MADTGITQPKFSEVTYQKLAVEIARDLFPLEQILKNHSITLPEWDQIQRNPVFRQYLISATEEWNGALSTHERVRVKASIIIEQWLVEATARLHDSSEPLSAKNELAKLVARLAGMGERNTAVGEVGEKFSVTINLGGDQQLKIEKQISPRIFDGEVIEGTVND